jgi:D-beta-D-heptose 7-phosphate kinase/D-beta-D-heptose 1-phosphate adenosyltransferase
MIDPGQLFAAFDASRVLVVGDSIIDVYTYGAAIGLAAETPTIVAKRTLGGAAFVCRNLEALGAAVEFVTLTGDDEAASAVAGMSSDKLALTALTDPGRPTTVKHRFWVDGYKVLQLDDRDDSPISDATAQMVIDAVEARLPAVDSLIVSDYRHGLVRPDIASRLLAMARAAGKPAYVDSQVAQNESNHRDYRGGAIICLNLKEARCVAPAFQPNSDPASFAELQDALEADRIVLKLGEDGAMLFDGRQVWRAPARPARVADVTGAGDAFLAGLALTGLAAPLHALRVANTWASLSIEIHGTVPPLRQALAEALTRT